jgi:hypothetical protein
MNNIQPRKCNIVTCPVACEITIRQAQGLLIVNPETVIAWHRKGFRLYWKRKARHPVGRPSVSLEVIHRMRRVQPPELGKVVELPEIGGLHHRYERRAA